MLETLYFAFFCQNCTYLIVVLYCIVFINYKNSTLNPLFSSHTLFPPSLAFGLGASQQRQPCLNSENCVTWSLRLQNLISSDVSQMRKILSLRCKEDSIFATCPSVGFVTNIAAYFEDSMSSINSQIMLSRLKKSWR